MTVQRQANLTLTALRPTLEAEGWDVKWDETLSATKTNAHGAFYLIVDKGGRVILRRTSLTGRQPGKVIHEHGRTYALQTETFNVTHITTTIMADDEFRQALADMLMILSSKELSQ